MENYGKKEREVVGKAHWDLVQKRYWKTLERGGQEEQREKGMVLPGLLRDLRTKQRVRKRGNEKEGKGGTHFGE